MLARLNRVNGVVESRVESTGRFFALALADDADEAAVLSGAAEALRSGPRRLGPDEAAAQLAAIGRGDPWFTLRDVSLLCFVESRMLAKTGADAVAASLALAPARRALLDDAIREVLFKAMERVLAEGGRDSSGWFYEEWPELAQEVARRAAAFLPPDQLGPARDALVRLHAP